MSAIALGPAFQEKRESMNKVIAICKFVGLALISAAGVFAQQSKLPKDQLATDFKARGPRYQSTMSSECWPRLVIWPPE